MYHFFWYIAWHEVGCNRVKIGCTYGICLKVVYTMWGIYHANYDIFHAIKVAKEVCMDWATGWRGPLLFSTVQISHFQVEVAQTKWHYATATLALWTGTERTVTFDSWHCPSRITAGTWSSVLMAVQIFYKFTSACVALAILQVRTKELIPEQLIVRH